MAQLKVLLYEDDPDYVAGLKFNVEPKCLAAGASIKIIHKVDDSTLMQDLQWIPDLIIVDHDLGTMVGTSIIKEITGDPEFCSTSIYYYSGGESIDDLKNNIKDIPGKIHCFIKDGDEFENAIISKAIFISQK